MNRFTGWTRGTMVAALMVLSTGACAQRVSAPPPAVQAQQVTPVAQAAPVAVVKAPIPKPGAPGAAVPEAPVPTPPVAKAPVPTPPVAKAPVPTPPVAKAPVVQAPVVKAPAPAPQPVAKATPAPAQPAPQAVAPPAPKPAPPAPEKIAEAPAPEPAPTIAEVVTPSLPPAPAPAEVAEVAAPAEPERRGLFDFLLDSPPARSAPPNREAAATRPALKEPARLGAQYQVAEVASADYGSTVDRNPTPDAALDIAELTASDKPGPAPVATAPDAPVLPDTPPVAEPDIAEAPEAPEPVYEPLSAFASLFGGGDDAATEEDGKAAAPQDEEEPSPPATPQAANVLSSAPDPASAAEEVETPEENPYPGGFADDAAYETAQLAQPNYGYSAPAPSFNANAPITVAILTPDSDSRPSIRTLARGLSQAAALSARALGDRQLVLRGYDTGGSPDKARLAAQQAVADGARLIIGPLFSGSAAAVAPVARSAGIPVIAFTTDESVLRRGVYSVGYLPDAEVDRMLSYAAKRGIRKIGLLSPDTPYGGIVYRNVQNVAPAYGVNVATVQPISPNFAQAAETGQRFAEFYQTNPDVQGVLIATSGKALQGIAAYLAYNDVLPSQVQYMGLGIWDDAETFREATLRGGWFPGLDPALKAEFESRYSSAYGGKPPAVAALAYDGVAIAGALLSRSKTTGQPPFTIQNIETPTGFRGMSGLFRFLPSGRNQRLLSILKVGRRQFEMVDPAPTTFGQRLTSINGYSQ